MSGFELAALAAAAGSSIYASKEESQQQLNLAAQLKNRANQRAASAQRAAVAERERANRMIGRARAVAAASGAGASDPTVLDIIEGLDADGTFNVQSRIAEGEMAYRSDMLASRTADRRAAASTTKGIFDFGSSVASMFAKYWMDDDALVGGVEDPGPYGPPKPADYDPNPYGNQFGGWDPDWSK